MLAIFLIGLISGAAIALLVVAVLGLTWFLNYSKTKIKESPEKKVVLVDLRHVYDDLKNANGAVKKDERHVTNRATDMDLEASSVQNDNPAKKLETLKPADKEIALAELEKMCSETPYAAAEYDPNTDTMSDYEAISCESEEPDFIDYMKKNDGLILVGA